MNAEHGYSGWSAAKKRLDAKLPDGMRATRLSAKGEEEDNPNGGTLHDLRRTFVTLANEELDIDPHHVEACVNHVSGHKNGIAGTYNRGAYREQKKAAFTKWGQFVVELVA